LQFLIFFGSIYGFRFDRFRFEYPKHNIGMLSVMVKVALC